MAEPKPYDGVTDYPVTDYTVTNAPSRNIVFTEPQIIEGSAPVRTADEVTPQSPSTETSRDVTAASEEGQRAAYALPFAHGLTGYPRQDEGVSREQIVQRLVDIVKEDELFMKYADDRSYRWAGEGAGVARDTNLFIKYTGRWGDQKKPVSDGGAAEYLCTGIADRAQDLISGAIVSGKLNSVRTVRQIERTDIMDHTAIVVQPRDGKEFVVDWHATLDARNPVIVTVDEFRGD